MNVYLNERHPRFNELSPYAIHELNKLHVQMEGLKLLFALGSTEGALSPDHKDLTRKSCEDLEYRMQELWGFSRDSSYHTHIKYFGERGTTCPG